MLLLLLLLVLLLLLLGWGCSSTSSCPRELVRLSPVSSEVLWILEGGAVWAPSPSSPSWVPSWNENDGVAPSNGLWRAKLAQLLRESGDARVVASGSRGTGADWELLLEQLWDASGGGVPLVATASGSAGVAGAEIAVIAVPAAKLPLPASAEPPSACRACVVAQVTAGLPLGP